MRSEFSGQRALCHLPPLLSKLINDDVEGTFSVSPNLILISKNGHVKSKEDNNSGLDVLQVIKVR